MNPFIIRPASFEDAPFLGQAGYDAWAESIGKLVPASAWARLSPQVWADFVRRDLANIITGAGRGEGGTEDFLGQPLGFVALEGGENYLSDLWVAPRAQGQGLGSALLAAAEERVAAQGYAAIHLEVMVENTRAKALYLKQGYQVKWTRPRHDEALGLVVDTCRLEKRL